MSINWIEQAEVSDGKGDMKIVKKGDLVDLLPEDHGGCPHSEEFMRRFLGGEGPYEIARIGEWPCGRDMLYLKTENGEAGAHATDFMYAGNN